MTGYTVSPYAVYAFALRWGGTGESKGAAGDLSHWVYIAQCADGSLYTGMSTDVDRRIGEHNAGTGAKYTRSRGPVQEVYREECEDRSAALKREAAIKRLTRAQKLRLIDSASD